MVNQYDVPSSSSSSDLAVHESTFHTIFHFDLVRSFVGYVSIRWMGILSLCLASIRRNDAEFVNESSQSNGTRTNLNK